MPDFKAVVTDYIGTLTNARRYTLDSSIAKLHQALAAVGFATSKQEFLDAYCKAHEKYRIIRYGELKEVTNSIWVSEALCSLGYKVSQADSRMNVALNVFFQDYIASLVLRPFAKKLLKKISEVYKVGLISNFTYAPVVYSSLRRLGLSEFFNVIEVSGENGFRKPHKKIFEDALKRLQVKPEESVYIGDSPLEDIKGASSVGFKTIFVSSQFYTLKDLGDSCQKPDFIAKDLHEVYMNLSILANS
jgi:putative hydrolase of the HAD superfamily